jgi:cytochrome c-type biogenesis protein CcmH/NrfF
VPEHLVEGGRLSYRTRIALGAAVFVTAWLALTLAGDGTAHAQELSPELEKRALGIERQLLCPQCTNKRLDVCELTICIDMREQVREQLVQGRTNDEIIFFFSNRYGQRVLADIPREGFNLVLFGWVGASFLLMTVGGALFLLQLRRSGRAHRAAREASERSAGATSEDEAWLDAELRPDESIGAPPREEPC